MYLLITIYYTMESPQGSLILFVSYLDGYSNPERLGSGAGNSTSTRNSQLQDYAPRVKQYVHKIATHKSQYFISRIYNQENS